MSSKIYFENNTKSLSRYIVRAVSEAYRFIHPRGAERNLRKLLLTPQSRPPKTVPDNISAESIETDYGVLRCYGIGEGPIILFVHGWSGSGAQFFDLMQTVVAMGYRAVTFDHYKHGHSKGVENNYPLFVKTIEYVADKLSQQGTLKCIVSHSMGSSATLDVFKEAQLPHFLIAPLFNFYGELETRITGAGISKIFFEKIISSIEEDYEMSVKDRNPLNDISNINEAIYIIHSRDDKFALYDYSEEVAQKYDNIALETLNGIGHMRIVGSDETQAALVSFLKEKI
ncbi:MAG: alpha/beta hydrolase [Cellvibrionaceae bacterium]